jgi:serine/threonine-protein kinase
VNDVLHRLSEALADRYRVDRELGAGGMATVYLAHDLKHDRDVAIKVLHPDLGAALGGERFLSEIRTTARLQHPHILPLLDSGEADGLLYYVMPLVTGETLRARLDRERQLPLADAVRIAREVASALDYAHRQNVIHRDIKPENILLHDGSALVADFGIALAVQTAGGARMTQTGLSLGTPSYMSPEQATGERTIDARSDVYALGAMTYEMLAGEPPFTGPTVQAIVAKVMSTEPASIVSLRKAVPANVAAAVHAALEKLPADRCDSAKAFGELLVDTRGAFARTTLGSAAATPKATPSRASRALLVGALTVAAASLGVAAFAWQRGMGNTPSPVVPLTLDLPNARPELSRFAVSGDGTRFAFATDEGIALRDVGQREFRLLVGTEKGDSPVFSPDGEWIAFEANGRLRKVPVTGGAPIAIVPNDSLLAGRVNWGDDGSIVFETKSVLAVIPVGGTMRLLSKTTDAEQPRFTPDGRGIFYVNNRQNAKLMYYDLALDSAFVVMEGAAEAQLLPTGHLIYGSATSGLYTVRYDATKHAVVGTPSPVVLDMQPNGAVAPFVVTRSGMLVYRAGVDAESRVVIRQPNGKTDTLPLAPKVLSYARFSPDGKSLALTIGAARGTNRHIAIYDFNVGTLTRITPQGGAHSPVWSPDGKRMAFTAEDATTDAEDIFVQPIDRSTPPVAVLHTPSDQHASAWPNDTMIVFSNNNAARTLGGTLNGGSADIVNPVSKSPPRPLLHAAWGESDAAISPDGRWMAFTSLESGTPEIHVRAFPDAASQGNWKVSTGGGLRARWSADGRTIYYHTPDQTAVRATKVMPGTPFAVGVTETVMQSKAFGTAWDLDRSTGRIAVTETVLDASVRIVVMQHWLDAFRRKQAEKP